MIEGENMFFSLIIPVFNNSKDELDQVIKALENQEYKKFEVLLIDDGSKEECAQLIDSLCRISRLNIQVFHIKHRGVSYARNYGIIHSKGEYIGFVDADDYVFPNMLDDAARVLEEKEYHVIYGLIKYQKNGEFIQQSTKAELKYKQINTCLKYKLYNHMFNGEQKEFITQFGYIGRGPVAKFIKRQFCLQNLFDVSLEFGEDEEWNLRILSQDIQAAIVYSTWYIYFYRDNSTLHRFRPDFILQKRKELLILQSYVRDESSKFEFVNACLGTINNIVRSYYLSPKYKGSIKKMMSEFNFILGEAPFAEIFKFSEMQHLPLKRIINFILIKTRLIFIFYLFSLRLAKRKG